VLVSPIYSYIISLGVAWQLASVSSDDSPMASRFRDLEPDAGGRGGGDDRLREPRDLDDILSLVRTKVP
jgi:hypothetical protein